MFKRIVTLTLSVVMLLLCLTAVAEDASVQMDLEYTGVRFNMPEAWMDLEGMIEEPVDYGLYSLASNVRLGLVLYRPVTEAQEAEMAQFIEERNGDFAEEAQETIEAFYRKSIALCYITGYESGKEAKDAVAALTGSPDTFDTIVPLGDHEGYSYIAGIINASNPTLDVVFADEPESIRAEYAALQQEIIDHPEYFTLIDAEVIPMEYEKEGDVIAFETTDLDGNAVSSAELFAANKVTMLNIWQTQCGPCIGELPELDKLNEEVKPLGGQVVGLCMDTGDPERAEAARELTADFNFLTLSGDGVEIDFFCTPLTYFVDSEGHVLGLPIDGAMNAEGYMARMSAYMNGEEPEIELEPVTPPDENTETATYVVYVVDQYGEPVPDASVTFCTPAACRVMVSDENGTIVFEGTPNAYHLSVIDLPDGYSSDDDDDIYTQVGSSGKTLVVTRDE